MAKTSKAKIVKDLHQRKLPLDEGMTVGDMEHRLNHWRSPHGKIVRKFKPHPDPNHVVNLLEPQGVAWIPDSDFADELVLSKKVMVLVACAFDAIPEGTDVLDVPKDYQSGGDMMPDEEE